MFSIDATELVEKAAGVDFELAYESLGVARARISPAKDEVCYETGSEQVPLFKDFVNFCLDTAIPIVTASNPSRKGAINFTVTRGNPNDRLHTDLDNDYDGPPSASFMRTKITTSFGVNGEQIHTLFPRRGASLTLYAQEPRNLSVEELGYYYTRARDGDVTVFDPDREPHAPAAEKRVFYTAELVSTSTIAFNFLQLSLLKRHPLKPKSRRVSRIPQAA